LIKFVIVFTFSALLGYNTAAYGQFSLPFEADQDNDGDPINEEVDIGEECAGLPGKIKSYEDLGMKMNMTTEMNKEDCDFVMHYLSGQCEKQNVEDVCTPSLADYLMTQGLLNTDYPTNTTRFNALLDELEQKRELNERQIMLDEQKRKAETPDWAENLPMYN
jgi:hypothetical protein